MQYLSAALCTAAAVSISSKQEMNDDLFFPTDADEAVDPPEEVLEEIGCYTLHMMDSFGDGWNTATFDIAGESYGFEIYDENWYYIEGSNGDEAFEEVCLVDGCYDLAVSGGYYPGEVSWTFGNLAGGAPLEGTVCIADGEMTLTQAPPFDPALAGTICEDSANGATDMYGDGCDLYLGWTYGCGFYDTEDFIAEEMCCACQGAQPLYQFPSILP